MLTVSVADEGVKDRIEHQLGALLRAGMIASAVVILIGGSLFVSSNGRAVPSYHAFRGEPASLTTIPGIFHGVMHGDARCLMQLGIVLLIGTPIARVVAATFLFLKKRDLKYAVVSGMVLAILLYSLSGR